MYIFEEEINKKKKRMVHNADNYEHKDLWGKRCGQIQLQQETDGQPSNS